MSSLERHLETHSRALHALACALVGAQDADDLFQETVVQALAAPPKRAGPLAGWFAQIVRHLASKHRRGERRRRRREGSLAPPPASPSPETHLATRETFARLTAAVLGLPVPYQDIVLRRYLQEQTPAEIAAQTGVPLATVKSRLQRGVDLLRQRLEREGGDWRGALAATFGVRGVNATVAAGITTGAVVMMGTGAKFATAAAGAALIAAAMFAVLRVGNDGALPARTGGPPEVDPLAATAPADSAQPPQHMDDVAKRTVANPPLAARTDLATVRGRVVDEHGQPRSGARVALAGRVARGFDLERAAASPAPSTWSDPAAQTTPADGSFAFAFAPPEDFVFQCTIGREEDLAVKTRWLPLGAGAASDFGDVVLPTPSSVRGRVVDTEGRRQVGVEVRIGPRRSDESEPTAPTRRFADEKTDAFGEFGVPRLAPGPYRASAFARRQRDPVLFDLVAGATAEVEIVVLRPDEQQAIRGQIVDERGQPLRDAAIRSVVAFGDEANARSERDGTFVLARPERALHTAIQLEIEGGGCERLVTEPVAWGTTDLVYTLRCGLILEVAAETHDGTRIPSFTAFAAHLPEGQFAEHQSFDFQHHGDAVAPASIARIGPLLRGRYLVRVRDAAGTMSSAVVVEVRDPGPVRVTPRVPRLAEATLRVVDAKGEAVAGSLVELIDPLGQRVDLDTSAYPLAQWGDRSGDLRKVELLQAGRTDAAGELLLRGPARDDLALRLRGERHQSSIVQPFALAAQPQIEVIVPRGATVTVRIEPAELVRQWRARADLPPGGVITRSDRARLPGIKVWRHRPGNPESLPPQWDPPQPFDEEGVGVVHGLPPGIWWLNLSLPVRGGTSNLQLDELRLADGEAREVSYSLPELLEGELRGRVLLNGVPVPEARVGGSVQRQRRSDIPWHLGDQGITGPSGDFSLHMPHGDASISVNATWPGTDDWFAVTLAEAIPVTSGAVVEHDIDLRMGRVRCTFRDSRGRPVAGLVAGLLGSYRTWSRPSDADGGTQWLALTAGEWRVVADPRRLLDAATRQAFEAAHRGEPDASRLVRVDLGVITVIAAQDREVEVRVPDDWFQ